MFCKNCGKELADNAKFCPSCGTPVAQPEAPKEQDTPPEPVQFPDAGSPAPESAAPEAPVFSGADPVEGSTAAETGSPAAEPGAPVYAPPAEEDGQGQPNKRRGKAGLVVLGAGAVAIVLLVVLLVKLFSGLGGGGKAAAYAYLNDDGELMYLADLKEKTKALEITDEADYSSSVCFSPDGKTVYFTDGGSTLYSIAVSELKKDGKPERISRNVSGFFVLDDGRLAYSEYDGTENKLSIYEKGESYRLLKGYSEYRFSEDQKTIYYTERDSADNTIDLYRMPVQKDAEEERLLKGASIIYNSYTSDTLVYGVQEKGDADAPGGGYSVTVYSCAPGGEKTKLVSDAQSIQGVKVKDGKVSFYYYEEKAEEHTLYDFVTDSKAGEDASTLSGERPVSPSWYDYYPSDYRVEDDGSVTYGDRNGNRYPVDVSSLLTDGKTVNDLYTWEVSPLAEADARERYSQVQADYDARIDAWNEAQERQNAREELKAFDYSQSYMELYHYDGGEAGDPIGTEIDSNGNVSAALNGVFLYRKVDMAGGKVGDLSELSYPMEVLEKLESGEGDGDWYQNVGGKESVLEELEDIASINRICVLNDKEVVLAVSDGTDDILQSYALGKDGLTFTATILDEDFSYPTLAEASGADVLYLFTEPSSGEHGTAGDFCIYKDGKLETIAQEVYGAMVLDESGATYLVTDIDSGDNAEVALLKDGKTTTVTDEMSQEPIFLDGSKILYLSDGDLMLWDGKESRQIARDVERIWASVTESYSTYAPY